MTHRTTTEACCGVSASAQCVRDLDNPKDPISTHALCDCPRFRAENHPMHATSAKRPVFHSPRDRILSGNVTIPQVFEWHAKENPDYDFFRFHDGTQIKTVTYREAIRYIHAAARYVNTCVGNVPGGYGPVAVVANTDTITYTLTCLGILRAGHPMFLISQRNVPAAVLDMLRKTNCRHVLASQDAPVQNLVRTVAKDLDGLMLHKMPTFEDLGLGLAQGKSDEPNDLPEQHDMDSMAMILHSSGSTNHPKPISWSHKRLVRWSTAPWYGEADMTSTILSIHGTPMFHGIGVIMYCFAVNNGMVLTCFAPSSPPTFPTPENVFDGLVKTSSECVMAAPAFVEMWVRDPAKTMYMKRMKALLFGGAPLNQEVGNALASMGISLYSLYGSTEVGPMARIFPEKPGMDWEYFELSPMHRMVTTNLGDGKYELVVLTNPDFPLPIINTRIDGVDGYATSDIIEPHPTRPGLWKFYGRLDDQIVLSNGEKTNPGPLEDILNEDPHVRACIMFGMGKFQNGVLIEPESEYTFDPRDITKLQEFRNQIWQTIERANAVAPQHSRLFKEMVMVVSPSKPFTYNIKGYPRRKAILKEYHEEIEALYVDVEQSTQSEVAAPLDWDAVKTQAFVRTVVEKVVNRSLPDDADFFRNGCDSLQATWIRNTILRAVREHSPAAAQRVHMNLVFQAPSISALTTRSSVPYMTHASTAKDLVRIAERYSANLPARPSPLRPREATQHVVLITGTTGGFGCDVLEHLLRDKVVAKVYAFNRPGTQAETRQRVQFGKRGLVEALLSSPKFQMVEASLDVPGFSIAPDLLEEIRTSLTHIMHNAWTVNFNLTLPSFEPDLKAVRNLVELALSSPFSEPPRFQLVSSIGVFDRCTIPPPVPEVPLDASSALGTGYGEAKWVAERVLQNVAMRTGMPTVIVRLGQVSGDKIGHWNEREWFPALVKSALSVRCLPDVEGRVSFIPGYPAARAFAEMRDPPVQILHLVHSRPVAWNDLIAPIADELGVPLVAYDAWLAALEKDGSNKEGEGNIEAMRVNPALQLLDFFRSRAGTPEGREPLGMACLSTGKARSVSETLANMPELGEADARRWVAAWRASGFLDAR
ncbi:acetyl-CoA synthetase-like protein [Daedaleopsis nitida]|nr:acetyl-CoA synthetase-like protein [Daedaleopsis nitida]